MITIRRADIEHLPGVTITPQGDIVITGRTPDHGVLTIPRALTRVADPEDFMDVGGPDMFVEEMVAHMQRPLESERVWHEEWCVL